MKGVSTIMIIAFAVAAVIFLVVVLVAIGKLSIPDFLLMQRNLSCVGC